MTEARSQIIRFGLVGTFGFTVDLGALLIAMYLGLGPFLGRALSFLLAVWSTWFLNRRFTFRSRGVMPIGQEQLRYLLAMCLGGSVNYAVYSLVVTSLPELQHAPACGVALGSIAGMAVNFAGARWWVFKSSSAREDAKAPKVWLAGLNTPAATLSAPIIMPVLFGLYSIFLGADANWDLYNYHLYSPFALLNDKLSMDLAAGGFQGYFNPLLDTLPYWLNTNLPPRVSGFIQGSIHGMAFVLVLGIARHALITREPEDQHRLPILLALAGCLTANFLSEIGNSMGDNTTAILVLSAVYLIISRWDIIGRLDAKAGALICLSGALVGLATGLKPTNAVSAIALCLALLLYYPGTFLPKIAISFLFGIGVVVGFSATGGFWMLRLWQEFGNPLFPQFGKFFANPLAQPISIADTRWLPRGFVEQLLWPFILSVNARRVGELPFRQIIWAVAYVLMVAWLFKSVWSKMAKRAMAPLDRKAGFVVVFVALSFFIWMQLFSIYRYTVPYELLTPLVTFILLTQLYPYPRARRISAWLLTIAAAIVVVVGGARTWGHEDWASPLYHTDLMTIEQPETATVILASRRKPLGWLATLYPPETAFIGLGTAFPAGHAFGERTREIVRTRGGPIYVFTEGEDNKRAKDMESYNDLANRLRLTHTQGGCDILQFVVNRMRFRAAIDPLQSTEAHCRVAVRPADVVDVALSNRKYVEVAAEIVGRDGFVLDPRSCKSFTAGIGKGQRAFQYCRANLP